MKSCHSCPAAFDHAFTMEFTDGKLVWFSAPTCQKKFKWITLLYKHRFNSNIEVRYLLGFCYDYFQMKSACISGGASVEKSERIGGGGGILT